MITRICKSCGKSFTTNANARMFCNSQCAKAKKEKKVKQPILWHYTCSWCGCKFKAEKKRKYCTETCRALANGRGAYISKYKSNSKSIAQINEAARAKGLTYGQYVARYGNEVVE